MRRGEIGKLAVCLGALLIVLAGQPAAAATPGAALQVAHDEGAHAEIVAPPKAGPAGKTTSAWTQREGETVQRQTVWDAWRKVKVVRRVAARPEAPKISRIRNPRRPIRRFIQ